jgi:hypothetical protein
MARKRTLRAGSASCKKAQAGEDGDHDAHASIGQARWGRRTAPPHWSHAASAKPANKEGGFGQQAWSGVLGTSSGHQQHPQAPRASRALTRARWQHAWKKPPISASRARMRRSRPATSAASEGGEEPFTLPARPVGRGFSSRLGLPSLPTVSPPIVYVM